MSGKWYFHAFCTGFNVYRMILYFPVSALVTLFGNILQNPQDPRARSDVRLMNMVVGFLSMLVSEEENGGVKRMLGVCSEFERIAKVVLDKTEKETSSRRKRKSHEDPATKTNRISSSLPPQTPMTTNAHTPAMAGVFSPNAMNRFSSSQNGYSPAQTNGSPGSTPWSQDMNGNEFMTPNGRGVAPFTDIQAATTNGINELNSVNMDFVFNQPFVPQDLWGTPMTHDWDWAEMTGGPYQSFENGLVGDPNLHMNGNHHLQHQQQGM